MTLYWISLDVSVLVVKRVHVLFTFLSIYVRVVASNAHCVVFLFCLFSSCSVPCVASFSGLSFFDCPYCILECLLHLLSFICLLFFVLFICVLFFLFRLFCFALFFVLFFILYVLFVFFVCAFKRTLKIQVICRKKIWYLPMHNRLCIPTKVFWINKKLWYKTLISTFRILLSYMHIIIHGRLSFKAVTKIRTLRYWHVQINEQHYF